MDNGALHSLLDEARISGLDIHEHIPTLLGLAASADQIVELGVNMGTSTLAFLAGGRGKVDSWDIVKTHMVDKIKAAATTRWDFHHDDSREADIPQCDLLFIDSYHSGDQLAAELKAHAGKVRGRIVLHDTESYGWRGESGGNGLRHALMDFLLAHHDEWRITEHYTNNNGLTILERIG